MGTVLRKGGLSLQYAAARRAVRGCGRAVPVPSRPETTGRVAALQGAIQIAHQGTQTHGIVRAEFVGRFLQHFNYRYV
jgi:hypothetical protein